MSSVLGQNNYGKSRIRLVKVSRHPGRHDLKELTVNIQFEGDFESSYCEGDNSKVLPTDTMKNTVYALAAQHPVEEIEEFARVLIDHFLNENAQVSRVRIEIAEHLWTRLAEHFFTPSGTAKRIAT